VNEDLSDLFEKFNINKDSISPEMINNLMGMFNNNDSSNSSGQENNSQDTTNSSTSGIDFETIMRMKSIIDKMNIKDDPRSKLLQSLKPYLKESRQSKIDQYIQLMNMSKVMEVFPFMGGEQNSGRK